uniref:Uncharacterized protein n=1 Tax=Oryza nivara TaxID=4536 RepID=A0A0E0J8X8_ORYNI
MPRQQKKKSSRQATPHRRQLPLSPLRRRAKPSPRLAAAATRGHISRASTTRAPLLLRHHDCQHLRPPSPPGRIATATAAIFVLLGATTTLRAPPPRAAKPARTTPVGGSGAAASGGSRVVERRRRLHLARAAAAACHCSCSRHRGEENHKLFSMAR